MSEKGYTTPGQLPTEFSNFRSPCHACVLCVRMRARARLCGKARTRAALRMQPNLNNTTGGEHHHTLGVHRPYVARNVCVCVCVGKAMRDYPKIEQIRYPGCAHSARNPLHAMLRNTLLPCVHTPHVQYEIAFFFSACNYNMSAFLAAVCHPRL